MPEGGQKGKPSEIPIPADDTSKPGKIVEKVPSKFQDLLPKPPSNFIESKGSKLSPAQEEALRANQADIEAERERRLQRDLDALKDETSRRRETERKARELANEIKK